MEETSVQHLGTKVRYSVQREDKNGDWYDLNQNWDGAKKAPYSVTRTIEDARHWKKRYEDALKRNYAVPANLRIVKVVTEYVEVQ